MKRVLLQFFVCCILSTKMFAQVNAADSLALVQLYTAANKPFNTAIPLSQWEGITVTNNRITSLVTDLPGPGIISTHLGNMTALKVIRIEYGAITGSIPESVGTLADLEVLNIQQELNSGEGLTGPIPASIVNLTKLKVLNLYNNQLSGVIPQGIGNLAQLEELMLGGSILSGPVPAALCNMPLLKIVDLWYNRFNFEGLECLGVRNQNNPAFFFELGFQAPLTLNNNNPILSVSAGGTLSKNTYQWYRDDVLVATNTGDSTYTYTQPGAYTVVISNSDVTNNTDGEAFVLRSDTVTVTSVQTLLQRDSLALVDFYNSAYGSEWWFADGTWLVPGVPVSEWGNVTVSGGRVTGLDIHSNNGGTIPESFGNLTGLKNAYLEFNGIQGSLPSSIGNLVNLEHLTIKEEGNSSDGLTGNIPASIGNLDKLKTLELSFNQLSGNIPATLTNLTNLERLELGGNILTGDLPDGLLDLPQLNHVDLWYNRFTFDVLELLLEKQATQPSFEFNFEWQRPLPLQSNNPVLSMYGGKSLQKYTYTWHLDGSEIAVINGDSTYTVETPGAYYVKVTTTDNANAILYSDTVTITNVYTLLQRDSMALVDLYNSTNGAAWTNNTNWLVPGKPINEWYGIQTASGRVDEIHLYTNNLNGAIPESFGDLTEVQRVFFHANQLNGAIPSSIGNLNKLETLWLYGNNLSGSIPASIVNASQLNFLDISHNALSGNLPEDIGNLTNLTRFEASNNQLSGSIPESLGFIPNLGIIFLQFNQLTGAIPASLGNAPGLLDLNLSNNKLSGSVSALSNSPSLWGLTLENNKFTFEGIESVITSRDGEMEGPFTYSPQAAIPLTNNNPTLSVSAGGTLANNTYTWFLDGEEVDEKTGDSTFTISVPGTYYVNVRNSIATELVLSSMEVVITVVESGGTLPLDFVDVKAAACTNGACIEWKTTNEQNTSHFEVEASNDGMNFKKLGNNVSSWNTPGVHTYNAVDNNPASGYNYYRIKQVDKDGVYKYSKTVSVNISVSGTILAAPNPTTGSFMLKGLDKADRISLYNVNGQLLKQWQNINGNKQLSIANLSNGLYIIKIDQGKKQTILRLLKQ